MILFTGEGWAYKIHPNAGETSAAFLKIPPGGRGVSMGEAQVGISSDLFGMWWNPACITGFTQKRLALSYNKWFQHMSKSFAAGVFPLSRGGSIGFMIDSLMMKSDIERRSGEAEDDPYYPTTSSEGEFGAYDLMVSGIYAKRLGNKFTGGISIKGILQNIDNEYAYSAGLDVGVHYTGLKVFDRSLMLGASIRNFGLAIKFNNEAYNLPLDYNLGFSFSPVKDLLIAVDFRQAIDNYLKIHTGFEYKLWNKLFLRTGYVYRLTGNPLGNLSGFRGGFGVKFRDFILDYSYAPYSYLGESHRISFQVSFGKKIKRRKKEAVRKRIIRKVKSKETAFQKSDDISVSMVPLKVSQGNVVWNIKCEKTSDGILKNIEYITVQENLEGIGFNIAESTEMPSGFSIPKKKKLIKYICIRNNLIEDYIKKCDLYFNINEGMENIEIINEESETIYIKKLKEKEDTYIGQCENDTHHIFILKNE